MALHNMATQTRIGAQRAFEIDAIADLLLSQSGATQRFFDRLRCESVLVKLNNSLTGSADRDTFANHDILQKVGFTTVDNEAAPTLFCIIFDNGANALNQTGKHTS